MNFTRKNKVFRGEPIQKASSLRSRFDADGSPLFCPEQAIPSGNQAIRNLCSIIRSGVTPIQKMCESAECERKTTDQLAAYHRNLCNITKDRLRSILAQTPLLRDISCDVTHDELAAEIAYINGASIKIYVQRKPYQELKVIVARQCKVSELKAAVRRTFEVYQRKQAKNACDDKHKSKHATERQRHRGDHIAVHTAKISWKYIWRTYYLCHNGMALSDNAKLLSDYGVRSKDVLDFVKKIKIDRKTRTNKKR